MIQDTYTELLIQQIIEEILLEGNNPTASEITDRYTTIIENNDLSKPLFKAINYTVKPGDYSSASKYNNLNKEVLRDLKVIYKDLIKNTELSISNFERWRNEAYLLEGRMDILEERLSSLLLLAEDTAGYFNFMQDNFVDASKTDLTATTAMLNFTKGIVQIGSSNTGATRHDLSSLQQKDVVFTVLSRSNLVANIPAEGSKTTYAIGDLQNFWQEKVFTNKPAPVSVELKINLSSRLSISRIDIDLHGSNSNSPITITPMYSTDNFNYNQLNTTNFTRNIVDSTSFQFPEIQADYIKFIMTKTGYDQVKDKMYLYEFGVDDIYFYQEAFTASSGVVFISQPLSVTNIDGTPEEFSTVVLETCEDIPENTSIKYYITASNDEDVPLTSAYWTPIDPMNREATTQPIKVDFGDLYQITVSGISLSYDSSESESYFVNPDKDFTIISAVTSSTSVEQSAIASNVRYGLYNSNDRILDHCMDQDISIAQNTLEIWRNISLKGSDYTVRGYNIGWGFEEPYYYSSVYVENSFGIDIDFGGKAVIVDGIVKTGQVHFTTGRHLIYIHKDNWLKIDGSGGIPTLADLKSLDSLYPYNHRYLVEGLSYADSWSTTEEKVYTGFDIVAQYYMKQVSPFDMIHNVMSDDYSKFAIDLDVEDTSCIIDGSSTTKDPMNVFLVKVDETNSDFVREKFLIKFKAANTLYKYLRLKAILETTDTNISPFLDSYRIKISS